MSTIAANLMQVHNNIIAAAAQFGRDPKTIQLLAVSKQQPVQAITEAWQAGQLCFGESYLQEALVKISALEAKKIEWHFIGPIQANKTAGIAQHFAWVQSVCRYKIAQRLNDQRPPDLPPLNVCIQVNVSADPAKEGVSPEAVLGLAQQIIQLPRLKLRGLMTIPRITTDVVEQRRYFKQLREIKEQLEKQGFELDTLSMGMSDDYLAAIAEGATLIRIGTRIFGSR